MFIPMCVWSCVRMEELSLEYNVTQRDMGLSSAFIAPHENQ